MGAKTWMLVFSNGSPKAALATKPTLDREATIALVNKLFAPERLVAMDDADLCFTCPPDNEIIAGCFPGVVVLAAKEIGIDFPSQLPAKFLEEFADGNLYLHAMHSVVDWLAFAVWRNGTIERSLSLSPDSGIVEDIGARLAFEIPYWAGEHSAVDPGEDESEYPFLFHPLELGEAALVEFFGYQLEGDIAAATLEPDQIALMRFKRKKSWWRFG